MSRSRESKKFQLDIQKRYGHSTEDRRQILIIGMLSDIADSLATLCDLYAKAHNYKIEKDEDNADRP